MAVKTAGKMDLNGVWDFVYSAMAIPVVGDEVRLPGKYDGKMVVPGYWDEHYELFDFTDGFGRDARFNPNYRPIHFPLGTNPPDASMPFIIGTGYYRKVVRFSGGNERWRLHFGHAMRRRAVFCNGRKVLEHSGYSTAVEVDLTPFLQVGDNELVLAVTNITADGANSTANGQHRGLAARGFQGVRGGIGGDVFLRITRGGCVDDYHITFEKSVPHWHVMLSGFVGAAELEWSLGEAHGTVQVHVGQNYFTTDISELPLWDDENPNLLTVTLRLKINGEEADFVTWRTGFRQISARGYQLILNDTPVILRGSTEHHYFPESGNAHNDVEKYCRDLGVLKRAGFNFLRCHTWCPPESFFTACDRLGMLVQTEVPPHALPDEWEEIIRLIRRHPCAVILCGGNEENFTPFRIDEVRRLAALLREMTPDVLFNPQEALPLIEYRLDVGEVPESERDADNQVAEPFLHNPKKLAELAEFSDVYGSYNWGFFSYLPDEFPGVAELEKRLSVYRKPCLSHEISLLGGWMDLSLESRYRDTWIGITLYAEIRRYLEKHHLADEAERFYRLNSLFVASLRKQVVENLRACPSMAGYDLLGGIDTHWHRCGYPCGVFNEFYEEKPGETATTFRRCNNDNVLLCDAMYHRNYFGGSELATKISLSMYGKKSLPSGQLDWELVADNGEFKLSGTLATPEISRGTLTELGKITAQLPELDLATRAVLSCRLTAGDTTVSNDWNFYVYPAKCYEPRRAQVATKLDAEAREYLLGGGRLLLLGGFPCATQREVYRTNSTGRCQGHFGNYVNPHPALKNFPNDGFLEWQSYDLMRGAVSLVFDGDADLPQFAPIVGLIPSFKYVERKAMLAEYQVGAGRLLMCSFALRDEDPAARYLRSELLKYLDGEILPPAPEWNAEQFTHASQARHVQADIAVTDFAQDPNAVK